MARGLQISTKRVMIDRANSTIVIAVGVCAFITAFCLVASKSLISRQAYQNRVIEKQEKARDQLRENIGNVESLKSAYSGFVDRQENIILGSSSGDGERDGDNARIVLDALPSKYDFPALVSSLEKILVERRFGITSIGGFDAELAENSGQSGEQSQQGSSSSSSQSSSSSSNQIEPGAKIGNTVEMPFEIGAEGSYESLTELLKVFKNSIRPMNIQILSYSAAEEGKVSLLIQGKSYYQPEKSLQITEEVVK